MPPAGDAREKTIHDKSSYRRYLGRRGVAKGDIMERTRVI